MLLTVGLMSKEEAFPTTLYGQIHQHQNHPCLLMVTMGRCVEGETSNSSRLLITYLSIITTNPEKATNIFLPKPALHIAIPARILRLGFPLLEARRPLQHLQRPHRRQTHLFKSHPIILRQTTGRHLHPWPTI